jgi:hypothetical protein
MDNLTMHKIVRLSGPASRVREQRCPMWPVFAGFEQKWPSRSCGRSSESR